MNHPMSFLYIQSDLIFPDSAQGARLHDNADRNKYAVRFSH